MQNWFLSFFLIILFSGITLAYPSLQLKKQEIYSVTNLGTKDTPRYDSVLIALYKFAPNGSILEESEYSDGTVQRKTEYQYNAKGKVTKEIFYGPGGLMNYSMIYKYGDKDSITEEVRYEAKWEMEYKKQYKYNPAGKKIREQKIKEGAGMVEQVIYNYDGRSNLTEQKNLDRNDSVTLQYLYKYDLHNNLLEEIRNADHKQEWKFTYIYTHFNKKEREVHEYPYQTSNTTTICTYDSAGYLTTQNIFDYKNQLIQKNIFKFKNGKLIEEAKNNDLTEFDYDAAGNKTDEKTMVNNQPVSVKKFNRKGDILSWVQYAPDKSISFEQICRYTPVTGILLETLRVDKNKSLLDKTEYIYDVTGNEVTETIIGAGDHVGSKKIFVNQYYYE